MTLDLVVGLLVILLVLGVFGKIVPAAIRQFRTGSFLAAIDDSAKVESLGELPAGTHMNGRQVLRVFRVRNAEAGSVRAIGLETHASSANRRYMHVTEIDLANARKLADLLEAHAK